MGRFISRELKQQIPSERCYYCGCELDANNRTYDHVIPVEKGGEDTTDNLVACCSHCNNIKKNYTLYELETALIKRKRFCDDEQSLISLDNHIANFSNARKRLRAR